MNNSSSPRTPLDDLWTYQSVVLADRVSRLSLSIARAKADLNLSQWRVLVAVASRTNLTSAEVVAMTPMDKGMVSRSVVSLIRAGLIEKTPDPTDKRRATLTLTPEGSRIQRRIDAKITAEFNRVQSALERANMSADSFVHYLQAANRALDT